MSFTAPARAAMVVVILLAGCSSGGPAASPDEGDAARRTPSDARTGDPAKDASSSGSSHDSGVTARDGGSDGAARGSIADAADAGEDARVTGAPDGSVPDAEADGACSVEGLAGQCMTVTACAAITDHTSTPGYCPGPASIECCTDAPSTADNPPPPAGYVLMQQSQVTPAMTTWAVAILDDPTTYPMFSTTTKVFGTLTVLARVEWHPPDFQNSVVHRGVTLYVPS